ncbi:MAG: hypothetical protein ABW178_08840 [Pseudoxanthomonas sp.]
MLRRLLCVPVLLLALAACQQSTPTPVETSNETALEGSGAVSAPAPAAATPKRDLTSTTQWPAASVAAGEAWVSCSLDYAGQGDGDALEDLAFPAVEQALMPCKDAGVVRVRYSGKINAPFTELVARVADMARRLGISKRVLDLNSTGGQVEDAMHVGDVIGGTHWTLWVREQSLCHSSCVLVLAAGDSRMISGKVGVHRMMRIGSSASSRSELTEELKAVQEQMHDYLQRNGTSVAVADLMMTIPNRQLRLLDATELREFGLEGINAVQDDLDRIRLTRECGEELVQRRDAFIRAFDRRCLSPGTAVEDINACGLELRSQFGFPDTRCPAATPLSEHDTPQLAHVMSPVAPGAGASERDGSGG